MYFNDIGFLLLLPTIIFAMYAQTKVKSTFNKYLKRTSQSGYTGYQVARTILDRNGLHDVDIEMIRGKLSDHYDPRKRVLRLSQDVYQRSSIASVGVAAHEVGHALQHANGYFPLLLRNNIAPIAGFGARFVWILVFGGLILGIGDLVYGGIFLYIAVVAFQVITLPVEFNASHRAIGELSNGIIAQADIKPTKKVLSAAALTYVAATLVGIAQLIRLVLLANRD